MLQFENAYFVDLEKGPVVDQLRKPMHYGNNKANRIGAIVTKNGQATALSGNCTGKAILGDDSWVLISNGVINGNEAYIELPSACYSVEGPIRIFVNINSDDTELTLLDLTGYVKATQTDSAIDPEHPTFSVSELERIITTGAQDQIEAIEAAGERQISAIEGKGQNVLDSIPSDYTAAITEAESALDQAENLFDSVMAAFVLENATGSIVTIPDGADSVPLKSLIAQINPVQAGSGDPSSENIRAITGWTGLQGFVSGKNILSGDAMRDMLIRLTGASDRWREDGRYFWAYGGSDASKTEYIRGIFKENTQYTFILSLYKPNSTGSNLRILYTDGTVTNYTNLANAQTKEIIAVTSVAGKTIEGLYGRNVNASSTWIYVDESGIFEGEITAAEYEAWKGQVLTIAFPAEAGTVYGGTLDVINGVLTVTHGYIASYDGETLPGEWISDRDVYAEGITPTTGAQVVYALSEPITYQVAPTEVNTLFGVNNIWADTGDVTVEYRADTKTYIDNRISSMLENIFTYNGNGIVYNG